MYVLHLLFISCCASVFAAPNSENFSFESQDDFSSQLDSIDDIMKTMEYTIADAFDHFVKFTEQFDMNYESEEEKTKRYGIFKNNLQEVNKLNNQSGKSTFGITEFMDLTPEEFRKRHTGFSVDFNSTEGSPEFRSSAVPGNCINIGPNQIQMDNRMPATFDWGNSGCVTPVKYQGTCNSCYAFATAGCMETQHCLTNGKLVNMAPQQIVDCDHKNKGCNRGFPTLAVEEVHKMGGIMSEADYPYTGTDPRASGRGCQFDQRKIQSTPTECYNVDAKTLPQMAATVFSFGPVVVTLCSKGMQFYTGGYLDGCCNAGPIDHVAIATGYGVAFGQQVVIKIKNTWGTNWGYGGYGYVGGVRSCGIFDWPAMALKVARL